MKLLLAALLSLGLAPQMASACMGGQLSFQLNGLTCVINTDRIVCGGGQRVMGYQIPGYMSENVRFGNYKDPKWGPVSVMNNLDPTPASNAAGLKLIQTVNADGNDDYTIYIIVEVKGEDGKLKRVRLNSNRVPGGGMTRSIGPVGGVSFGGVEYQETNGC